MNKPLTREQVLGLCRNLIAKNLHTTAYIIDNNDAALRQQLATMTQERDQWKQGHNDAVRVGLEYQRQLTIATGDLEAMTVETNMLLTENRKLKQQLAAVTQERDEQCAGKMAFFEGMDDMREQRTKLERQLTKVTSEKLYHMDCINLLARHIGRLSDTSNTVVDAAIQQLAAVTQERDWLRALYETDIGRQVPTKREGLP